MAILVDVPASAVGRAIDVVGRRLLDALAREGLAPVPAGSSRHGFGRSRVTTVVTRPPRVLLREAGIDAPHLAAELDDAVTHLAAAYQRRVAIEAWWRAQAGRSGQLDAYGVAATMPPDESVLALERLGTEGHNLHPCGRTRLGWTGADADRYDQEAAGFPVALVGIRREVHVGDDLGARLGLPEVPGYAVQPVHPWQLEHVLRSRYADAFADAALREIDADGPVGAPTASVRTLLLNSGDYLKLSLDIQITSTRRSISVATTHNGPGLSSLLPRLWPDPGWLLLPEVAGAALADSRDAAAILRERLHGRLEPGEVAVPATALPATSPLTGRTVLAEIVDRSGLSPADFLARYARVLLTPVLRLLAAGVGLEAHLQNSIPIFQDGRPTRVAFRDLGGPRVNQARVHTRLWPSSVVAVDDQEPVRAKAGYTAFQAHLGEVVLGLGDAFALPEAQAWAAVRTIVEEVAADDDRAALLAPTVPHKALVRMRLRPGGDIYVPVPNPLAAP